MNNLDIYLLICIIVTFLIIIYISFTKEEEQKEEEFKNSKKKILKQTPKKSIIVENYTPSDNILLLSNNQNTNNIENIFPPSDKIITPIDDLNILMNDLVQEPQFFNPLDFPENTSLELKPFTSDSVTDMYSANTIPELYNKINADPYLVYKNNDYML
jgi:uncharacterized protein (UPF0333 family)